MNWNWWKFSVAALLACLTPTLLLAQVGPPQPPPQPPSVSSLVGTEWVGSESLQKFGALTFQFKDQTSASMIDTAGTWPGTYTYQGQNVTLKFFDGKVTYSGVIAGNDMSGNAENAAGGRWTWKVTLKSTTTVTPGPGPGPGPGPSPTVALTPETLPEYLRSMGFTPQVIAPSVGDAYCLLNLRESDGWTFLVEVSARKTGGGMWFTAPLLEVPPLDSFSAAKLVQVLEANQASAPCFFSYRTTDNKLCMRLEIPGVRPTEPAFRSDLQLLVNQVRRTYPLWNTATWKKAA